MPTNLQIILVAGAILLFLIVMYLFFRPMFTRALSENSIEAENNYLFSDGVEQGSLHFDVQNSEAGHADAQELIILNLISMDKSNFDMSQVLTLLKNLDAKYSDGFFSYPDAVQGEIFRIASGINPGVLESDTQTHNLLLAMDLYQVRDPIQAFNVMLEIAYNLAEKLDASICDGSRAPLNKQMIQHLKSKSQDVSRVQASLKQH